MSNLCGLANDTPYECLNYKDLGIFYWRQCSKFESCNKASGKWFSKPGPSVFSNVALNQSSNERRRFSQKFTTIYSTL